jgi:hypothetical protein
MTITENEVNITDLEAALERIRAQADMENLRITQPVLIIITVYEPKPPKWITPTHRR